MLNVLKAIGFVDDSGVPTRRYHEYLDQSQSATVLAQGIKEAYADLFSVNKKAHEMTAIEVKNKMKTLSEGQYTDRVLTQMAGTFVTLVKAADFSSPTSAHSPMPGRSGRSVEEKAVEATPTNGRKPLATSPQLPGFGSLVYNINIHLPESRDQAVYDALFKALREHLS